MPADPVIDVSALTEESIPQAAPLLNLYAHPDDAEGGRLSECHAALKRFLAYPWAQLWLARSEGECVGFISLAWTASTSTGLPVLRVQGLYTLPAYRRRGVASALLRRAAELARERGAHRLQLETDTDNVEARRLYERLGFEWLPRREVYMHFL